ncbi:MAG: T9SS type A sorting domain-containing protein, partial [Candidatus Neomarinimicrobiota bacterium]
RPEEWIELLLGSGSARSGFTDTVDVFFNNESEISAFTLTVADWPDYLRIDTVLVTERMTGFSFTSTDPGTGPAQISAAGSGNLLAAGAGAVCRLVFRAQAAEPTIVALDITAADIRDAAGTGIKWTQTGAGFEIQVDTQTLVIGGAVGGDTARVVLVLHNLLPVAGLQVELAGVAAAVTGIKIERVTNLDWTGWNWSSSYQDSVFMFSANDLSNANPLLPGIRRIADLLVVRAAADTTIVVDWPAVTTELIGTDSSRLYTEIIVNPVSLGEPDAVFSIMNLDLDWSNGRGAFEIQVINRTMLTAASFELFDLPEVLTVTGVYPLPEGVWPDVIVSDTTGERDNGSGFVSVTGPAGLSPAAGPFLKIEFEFDVAAVPEDLLVIIASSQALGQNNEPLSTITAGYEIYLTAVATEASPAIPDKFALHPNYPNPFNPVTTIRYDIVENSQVRLTVFDMMGREVITLVNQIQEAGEWSVDWDGKNKSGQLVGTGIYLYRLKANENTAIRKMLLVK